MGKKKKPKKKRCSSPRKHQTESFVLCFSSRTWFGFLQNRYPLTIHIICAFCIAPHAKHWLGKPRLELKERAFLWEKSPVRQKSTEKLFCPFILVHLFCYHHTHYFLGKKGGLQTCFTLQEPNCSIAYNHFSDHAIQKVMDCFACPNDKIIELFNL